MIFSGVTAICVRTNRIIQAILEVKLVYRYENSGKQCIGINLVHLLCEISLTKKSCNDLYNWYWNDL